MSSKSQSYSEERKIAEYRLRIDKLIAAMNKDNILEKHREISALKYKIKALLGHQGDHVMDWGVKPVPGVNI